MTGRDPMPRDEGMSYEEMRLHTDIILRAGELADALEKRTSSSSDHTYSVSDPRFLELLDLPDRMLYSESPSDLRKVDIRAVIYKGSDQKYYSTFSMDFHFSDAIQESTTIRADNPAVRTYTIELSDEKYLLYNNDRGTQPTKERPEDVSKLVARILFPAHDPLHSDYRNLGNIDRIREVCARLDDAEHVDSVIEKVFEFAQKRVLITKTSNGKLLSCQIIDSPDPSGVQKDLTVKLNTFFSETEYFELTPDNIVGLIAGEVDISHFLTVIHAIRREIGLEEELVDGDELTSVIDDTAFNNSRDLGSSPAIDNDDQL